MKREWLNSLFCVCAPVCVFTFAGMQLLSVLPSHHVPHYVSLIRGRTTTASSRGGFTGWSTRALRSGGFREIMRLVRAAGVLSECVLFSQTAADGAETDSSLSFTPSASPSPTCKPNPVTPAALFSTLTWCVCGLAPKDGIRFVCVLVSVVDSQDVNTLSSLSCVSYCQSQANKLTNLKKKLLTALSILTV